MNYIDILVLLFLLYGAFRGFSRGGIVGVATLAGWLLGGYAAIRYAPAVKDFLKDFMDISPRYLSCVAMVLTFVVVALGVYVVGKLLTKIAEMIALGLLNRLLGALLGLAKYFIVVCAVFLIADALDEKFHFWTEETKQKSVLFYPVLHFAREVYRFIRG